MELSELIEKIDELKAELEKLKPIKPEFQRKLDDKIRLEFSYNSNHIEGNTLTYGETELLLIRGKTRGNHDAREYDEMKGHDLAFTMIKEWAADAEHPLTENMIKELNNIILKEPFWKEAITPDGQPTRRLIKIGGYKEYPNSVRLQNGEIFEYASVTDTPIKMGELMEWYRKEEESWIHPSLLAALLHYNFVRIHPFDDGNGRVSRLLMNYVLLKNDLPPVIIKSGDKSNYLAALINADTGDMDSFFAYVANELIWSLELSIKAAKGESIEEPEDVDKEINLLKRESRSGRKITVKKTREAIQNVYRSSLQNLFVEMERQLSTFDELFFQKDVKYTVQQPIVTDKLKYSGGDLSYVEDQIFFDANNVERYGEAPSSDGAKFYIDGKRDFSFPDIDHIRVTFSWKNYHSKEENAFDIYQDLEIYFSDTKYVIGESRGKNIIKQKLYDKTLSNEEVIEIASAIKKQVLNKIKEGSERT